MKNNRSKALVTWWGSLEGGGETAGDLMAFENVLTLLKQLSISYDVASIEGYSSFIKNKVDLEQAQPENYNVMIFVCGPIIKNDRFVALITKFKHCLKIAIGVSILSPQLSSAYNPFDITISRDNYANEHQFFDIALASLSNRLKTRAEKVYNDNKHTIGFCLRGAQREYGLTNCLSSHVDEIIQQFVSNGEYEIINISTKLSALNNDPNVIYRQFSIPHLVITTRLHGALFCIGNNTPFIAIDQIKQGAKLQSVIGNQLGWKHFYLAEKLSAKYLKTIVSSILAAQEETVAALDPIRKKTINLANLAIGELSQKLKQSILTG